MTPGVRGGTAGLLLLLGIVVYLLIAGGEDPAVAPSSDSPAGGSGPARSPVEARVVGVVDGDTIEVGLDGGTETVRYIGVDTPETVKPGEPVQCYGPEASAFNHGLVEGKTVRLDFDRELRDVYGRLLAYVHLGDLFVNAELIRDGYARTLEIPPNTARAGHLGALEEKAGQDGIGLWAAC